MMKSQRLWMSATLLMAVSVATGIEPMDKKLITRDELPNLRERK